MVNDNEQPDSSLEVPARFRDALSALHNERLFVPPQVDEAVLTRARERLQTRSSRPQHFPHWPRWVALAACVMILAWIGWNLIPSTWTVTEAGREDIDGDGQVDIFDAFALARRIEEGATKTRWDVDGDGLVNRADAEAVAARAVRLGKGGRS